MFTKLFWKDAAERAIKTAAQVASGYLAVVGTTDWEAGWQSALTAVGVAVAGSLISSILSSQVGSRNSASLVDPPPPPAQQTTYARPGDSSV